MSTAQPPRIRSYIHYDPERTDYSVTPEEFQRLCAGVQNVWKDACLVLVALGIPAAINAGMEIAKQSHLPEGFSITLSIFLNSLVGIVCLILGGIFGIAWRRSHKNFNALVEAIKKKPKMEITLPEAVNVGELPSAQLEPTPQSTDDRS